MAAPPLTHHEILSLVEPFTRRGRQVDLAASDRAARMLLFKPVDLTAEAPEAASLRETLKLECHDSRRFTLTRVLTHPSGLQATLQVTRAQPVALLAQLDFVAPQHQFQAGPGFVIARSYQVESPVGPDASVHAAAAPLILSRGVVQVDGLTLVLKLLAVRGVAADITLTPALGATLDLPEDLLAVMGWNWVRLVRGRTDWTSKLRLRGSLVRRSRGAEVALSKVATHLVQVFAEAPSRFHERFLPARWGVVLRRAIPSLTVVLLIVSALMLPRMTDNRGAGLWMALQYVPIALLALSFRLQELSQFEIPRPPRRLTASHWREPVPPRIGGS
jgi:hypothetical protein